MKHLIKAIPVIAALASYLVSCKSTQPTNLPTQTSVDLKRYTGQWYEVFRLPNSFQKTGAKAQANYSLNPDGSIKVVNSQISQENKLSSIEGTATQVSGSNGSRLKVRFKGFASLAPVPSYGNYWILHVEPDYSAALVGTPDRKYLWMLARDPQSVSTKKVEYANKAKSLGFDTEKLWYAPW